MGAAQTRSNFDFERELDPRYSAHEYLLMNLSWVSSNDTNKQIADFSKGEDGNCMSPNRFFEVSPAFMSSLPIITDSKSYQMGPTLDVHEPIPPESDGYIRAQKQSDQITFNRFSHATITESITTASEPFNMLNAFAGLHVAVGNNGRLLMIHGYFRRPMNKIHLTEDAAYEFVEYKMGKYDGLIKDWGHRNISIKAPANSIITGIIGSSLNAESISKLYFIIYNLKTFKYALQVVAHAIDETVNVVPSVYIRNPTSTIASITFVYSPSNFTKDATTLLNRINTTAGYFEYYSQFATINYSLDSNNCIALPSTFKSNNNTSTGAYTIYKHHQNQPGYNATPSISVNIPANSYISGIYVGQSSQGRMLLMDFMINKYTNSANPNDSIKANIRNPIQSIDFVDNYKDRYRTCILPPNSYLCGLAAITSNTDHINYGTDCFVPIIKFFKDPYTPHLYFSSDMNNYNFPPAQFFISKAQYFYFDANKSFYSVSSMILGYNPAGGVGASIESMKFADITDRVLAMYDPTYAGKMVLSQYDYLTDQQYTSQLSYTDEEKKDIAKPYCVNVLTGKVDASSISACKAYSRYNSNIDLDKAITSYCTKNPADDFCSCSLKYKDPGLESSDPAIRDLVYNNRVCYYPKCREAGYKFTTQVDRDGNPLECKVPLQICSQRIDSNASTFGIIKDIQASCQSSYGTNTNTNTPTSNNYSVPTDSSSDSNVPYIIILLIILIVAALAYLLLDDDDTNTNPKKQSVSGGNPKNNNNNNINSIDYKFV